MAYSHNVYSPGGAVRYRVRHGRPDYAYNCGDRTCGASDCGSCRNGAPPWEEECAGAEDDCPGCDSCLEIVESNKYVIARAPRTEAGRKRRAANGIEPGDRICVTRGFEYQRGGGPRTRYFYGERLIKKAADLVVDNKE